MKTQITRIFASLVLSSLSLACGGGGGSGGSSSGGSAGANYGCDGGCV